MTTHDRFRIGSYRLLRLWPGIVLGVLLVVLRFGLGNFGEPRVAIAGVLGAIVCGLGILVWWVFFSRAPWVDRLAGLGVFVAAVFATYQLVHISIRTGAMGALFFVYGVPLVCLALVVWAVAARDLSGGVRRATMVLTILVASGFWTLLRTDGIKGSGGSQFKWRWTPTHEEQLLAEPAESLPPAPPASELAAAPAATPTAPPDKTASDKATVEKTTTDKAPAEKPAEAAPEAAAEWPGFRGPNRDGVVRNVRIETDWTKSPPAVMWRRPIGPGWSSFAVRGDLLYTQEQRGDHEIVTAYRVSTGKPMWAHRDAVRFWESNGGAGPRATPALAGGRLYTYGATGVVNALDGRTGALIWTRNAATDTRAKVPHWGFSASPLVFGDVVVVHARGLAAYGRATGELRWSGPPNGGSYSSPHLATIGGVPQIVQLTGPGAAAVSPADGKLLWEHAWPGGVPIVQPAFTPDGDLLISTSGASGGIGVRRLAVRNGSGAWSVEERWTSPGLKPYFNDYVVHEGHVYGFDNRILSCIDLKDGGRKWKGGRFGHGQLVLLPEQDLLLVLSEDGELALVRATPEEFTEIARVPGIEGKTWNHPAVVGHVLLVRNGQEMAAFRLPAAAAGSPPSE